MKITDQKPVNPVFRPAGRGELPSSVPAPTEVIETGSKKEREYNDGQQPEAGQPHIDEWA